MNKPTKQNNQPNISIQQTSFYSGKLPPPEMMQQYNIIQSDFAERILSMSENEQKHNHKIERNKLTISVFMAIFGMIVGLLAMGIISYLIYFSIVSNQPYVAVSLTGIIVGVLTVYVLRKPK